MDRRLSQRKLTLNKRKQQTCKVYEVKIDKSHLSVKALTFLNNLFKEAKWYYNYALSHENIEDTDTTIKSVPVKVGEQFEQRDLTVLQAQVKQAIKTRLFGSLVSLSELKKKGHKVGRLKFKSILNSIPLKQYDKTYFLDFVKSKIRIQGLTKTWLRVNGLDQIPQGSEIANAVLVRKAGDYYLNITTYQNKQKQVAPEASIGIDFGCETQLTFSDGSKVEFEVKPSKRLRKLDRKIMKGNRRKSNNKSKDQAKRQKLYNKLTNKKRDIRNKLVNAIITCYHYVCFQDENVKAWQSGNHGKKITNTGIGGILTDLKHKAVTPVEVNRFFPSTQLCPNCGQKNKLELNERLYSCSCGYENDRDVKSAICIEREAMKQLPMDHREVKLGEISTSTFFTKLSNINGVKLSKLKSLSQEAPPLAVG